MTYRICAAVLFLASAGAGCVAGPAAPKPSQIAEFQGGENPPQERSAAKLEVRDFTVTSGREQVGSIWYTPSLTLAETSGLSFAETEWFKFELLDIGIAGKVPTVVADFYVPAGGTVKIAEDDVWGGPWVYITNRLQAPRVHVTIAYTDHSGRPGIVTAMTDVSR